MRKLKSVGIVVSLLGILLAVGLWSRAYFHPKQISYLSDGSTLVLESWDYGTKHVLKRHGDRFWQLFQPVQEVATQDTNADALVLWLHITGPAGHTQLLPTIPWWDWAEVSDDRGHLIQTVNYESAHVRVMSETSPLSIYRNNTVGDDCLMLDAFPRRGTKVITRFFLYGRQQPVAEFTVPNPTPKTYPNWTPQPLPLTQQQGDVKVSLVALQPGKYYTQHSRPNTFTSLPITNLKSPLLPGELGMTDALFQVVELGKASHSWQYDGIPSFQDATGNIYHPGGCFGSPPGQVSVGFQRPNTLEPCKLIVSLHKTTDATYLPQQLHTLSAVPVASPNTFLPSGASFQYKNHIIKLLGTGGSGRIKYPATGTDQGEMLQSNAPSLRFEISPPDPDLHLVLKAADDRGKPIHGFSGFRSHPWLAAQEEEYGGGGVITNFDYRSANASSTGIDSAQKTFFLDIPPRTRSLNLTVAVDEKRTFEFLLPAL